MLKIDERFALSTDDIVRFLSRRDAYPEKTESLTVKETHMSWVFLTDQFVYKMKKPVKYAYLDFSTLEKRKRNCEEEILLNKDLAPGVYKGLYALTQENSGNLKFNGNGIVIEWLIKMDRLPDEKMLDHKITQNELHDKEIVKLGKILSDYYQRPHILKMDPEFYIQRLRNFVCSNLKDLKQKEFAIVESRIDNLLSHQLRFISDHIKVLEKRTEKITEVHGDLRPEHVCLLEKPVIIDCLEFNRDLRIMDPMEELAFFSIECELQGSAWIGDKVIEVYQNETHDRIDNDLLNFYKSIRSVLRALSSYRHILEQKYLTEMKWKIKGEAYLDLADKYLIN